MAELSVVNPHQHKSRHTDYREHLAVEYIDCNAPFIEIQSGPAESNRLRSSVSKMAFSAERKLRML